MWSSLKCRLILHRSYRLIRVRLIQISRWVSLSQEKSKHCLEKKQQVKEQGLSCQRSNSGIRVCSQTHWADVKVGLITGWKAEGVKIVLNFSGNRGQNQGVCRGHQKPLLCFCAKGRGGVDCQVYSSGFSSQPAAGNFHLHLCPDICLVSQDWMTAGMLGARTSIFRTGQTICYCQNLFPILFMGIFT